MTRPRTYYTLLTRDPGDYWKSQFGDWYKSVVEQERRDSYARTDWKIIQTSGEQRAIDARIAELNRALTPAQTHPLRVALNEAHKALDDATMQTHDAQLIGRLTEHMRLLRQEINLLKTGGSGHE